MGLSQLWDYFNFLSECTLTFEDFYNLYLYVLIPNVIFPVCLQLEQSMSPSMPATTRGPSEMSTQETIEHRRSAVARRILHEANNMDVDEDLESWKSRAHQVVGALV